MERELRRVKLLLVVLGVIVFVSPAAAQTDTASQKVIDEARQQYSMLARQGVTELKASVTPNWVPLLSAVPSRERLTALTYARKLQFTVSVAADTGVINVSHKLIGPRPPKVRFDALESTAKGIEMSILGFFMSWAPFMLTYVIPEKPEQLVFQDLGTGYLLTFKDHAENVSVELDRGSLIKELRSPLGVVRPEFLKTKSGYQLTGYEGDLEVPDLGHVTLKTTITSGAVQGMTLPTKVVLISTIGTGSNRIELAISNYQMKKRI
jgi:hypothetical protein